MPRVFGPRGPLAGPLRVGRVNRPPRTGQPNVRDRGRNVAKPGREMFIEDSRHRAKFLAGSERGLLTRPRRWKKGQTALPVQRGRVGGGVGGGAGAALFTRRPRSLPRTCRSGQTQRQATSARVSEILGVMVVSLCRTISNGTSGADRPVGCQSRAAFFSSAWSCADPPTPAASAWITREFGREGKKALLSCDFVRSCRKLEGDSAEGICQRHQCRGLAMG